MRITITLFFILILGVQTIHQGLIYAYYAIHKDYISQELCENKDQPELKCNGKCHLTKVLKITKKHSPKSKPFQFLLEEIKAPTLFFQEITESILAIIFTQKDNLYSRNSYFEYSFNYLYSPVFKTLRPPEA